MLVSEILRMMSTLRPVFNNLKVITYNSKTKTLFNEIVLETILLFYQCFDNNFQYQNVNHLKSDFIKYGINSFITVNGSL